MRTINRVVRAIVAICVIATAADAGAAPIRLDSRMATATFSVDADCTRTIVQINVIRDTTHQAQEATPTVATRVIAFTTKYDLCSGPFPVLTFQGEGGGFISNDLFEVTPAIDAATLAPIPIPMFDWKSQTEFGVEVALTWTGQGGVTDSHGHFVGDTPDTVDVQNNRFRDASVTVDLFEVRGPFDIPLGSLVYGQLASVHSTVMR